MIMEIKDGIRMESYIEKMDQLWNMQMEINIGVRMEILIEMVINRLLNGQTVANLGVRMEKKHRDGDKPAVERVDGTLEYYKDGKRHRDGDKPAIIDLCGNKSWWKNGTCYFPVWKDIHTRLTIKIATLELPMLILLEIVSRICHDTVLTDYQVTEIITSIRN